MSEELRVTFGGEVSEKVGPELTQSLDQLTRSLDTLSQKGAHLPAPPSPQASGVAPAQPGLIPQAKSGFHISTREEREESARRALAAVGLTPDLKPISPEESTAPVSPEPENQPDDEKELRRSLDRQRRARHLRKKKAANESKRDERHQRERERQVQEEEERRNATELESLEPGEIPLEGPIPRRRPEPPPLSQQKRPPVSPFVQHAIGIGSSAVSGTVGGMTGSPTLGGLAGTGIGLGAVTAIASGGGTLAVAAGLGIAAAGATVLCEAFHALKGTMDDFRAASVRTIEGLSRMNPTLAAGEAETKVALLRQRLEQVANPQLTKALSAQQDAERLTKIEQVRADEAQALSEMGLQAARREGIYAEARRLIAEEYEITGDRVRAMMRQKGMDYLEWMGINPENVPGIARQAAEERRMLEGRERHEREEAAFSAASERYRAMSAQLLELRIQQGEHYSEQRYKEIAELLKSMKDEQVRLRKVVENMGKNRLRKPGDVLGNLIESLEPSGAFRRRNAPAMPNRVGVFH